MSKDAQLQVYEEELRRKDEEIKHLREENALLLRTSLRNAEEKLILQEKLLSLERRR